ncbi:MAG: tRNA 2-thiouridine(34) synthase MnmA [Phycisphaerales bacterium]
MPTRTKVLLARTKVLLAMSGGVDSSVAAALLLRAGYDVVGCFMRLGSPGEALEELVEHDACAATGPATSSLRIGHQGCCSINDAADARLVASRLGIPFYVCNFKKDFGRIIDYFVAEYDSGRTPNPCVRCNDWLKFGKLHDYARQIDADFVATGHYAQVVHDASDGWTLRRGLDRAKDQSYVLFGVPRARLAHMLLPIGAMRKPDVRALARELDLPVGDKPDSQEICFVPDNDYAGLVRSRTHAGVAAGAIIDASGRTIGEHPGHQHFTIGQRRGVGVAFGRPIYVVDKDPVANTITVGERDDLLSTGCTAREANWLIEPPPVDAWRPCAAKIRSHGDPTPARVRRLDETSFELRFDRPQFAIAPGQAAVLYDGEIVMGGGWIADAGGRGA